MLKKQNSLYLLRRNGVTSLEDLGEDDDGEEDSS